MDAELVHRQTRCGQQGGSGDARRAGGFTLVELLTVILAGCLLVGLLAPTMSAARRLAAMSACAARMRTIGTGLMYYATANTNHLPPFAFSDLFGNLPLSGHWGGSIDPLGPDAVNRDGVDSVNLWPLVEANMMPTPALMCPGADQMLHSGGASYFSRTPRFSTYCLRMLYSEDLFRDDPVLAYRLGGLLSIYILAAGGEVIRVGQVTEVEQVTAVVSELLPVPCVRLNRSYRETNPATGVERTVDPMSEPILSDTFWYRGRRVAASEAAGETYDVVADWCHGRDFNVMLGNGAVHRVTDDGTLAGNCVNGDQSPPDDGAYFASYAVAAWRFMTDNR
jgi:competence protein ComGC